MGTLLVIQNFWFAAGRRRHLIKISSKAPRDAFIVGGKQLQQNGDFTFIELILRKVTRQVLRRQLHTQKLLLYLAHRKGRNIARISVCIVKQVGPCDPKIYEYDDYKNGQHDGGDGIGEPGGKASVFFHEYVFINFFCYFSSVSSAIFCAEIAAVSSNLQTASL